MTHIDYVICKRQLKKPIQLNVSPQNILEEKKRLKTEFELVETTKFGYITEIEQNGSWE